jgi:hypothetical protein
VRSGNEFMKRLWMVPRRPFRQGALRFRIETLSQSDQQEDCACLASGAYRSSCKGSEYPDAIKHRMDEVGSAYDPDDQENPAEKTPVLRKLKKKAESSAYVALQAHPT